MGLGRVGLPTAARLAAAGVLVTGVERDSRVRASIAEPHPTEPGLDALLAAAPFPVVDAPVPADVYAICVGTPLDAARRADLRDLFAAVDAVAAVAAPGSLVVLESTVPVGTTHAAAARLPGRRVAVCPERVLPGDALREIAENPRLVGGVDSASTDAAAEWLGRFVRGPITRTDARTAELAKLVENAARDVEIALANTVAAVARGHGVDPHALVELVNQHPRVSLRAPGIGVGGHCLPVDPWFLADPELPPLVGAARAVNDALPAYWADAIVARAAGRPIGLLGLAYKPGSDDLRHSPAAAIARDVAARADVLAHDPHVSALSGVPLADASAVAARPLVALLVPHREYRGLAISGELVDPCGARREVAR